MNNQYAAPAQNLSDFPTSGVAWTGMRRYSPMQYANIRASSDIGAPPIATMAKVPSPTLSLKLLKSIELLDEDSYRMRLILADKNREVNDVSQKEFKTVFQAAVTLSDDSSTDSNSSDADDNAKEMGLNQKVSQLQNVCKAPRGLCYYLLWKSKGDVDRAAQKFWESSAKYKGKYYAKVVAPNGAHSKSLIDGSRPLNFLVEKMKQSLSSSGGQDVVQRDSLLAVFVNGIRYDNNCLISACELSFEEMNKIFITLAD